MIKENNWEECLENNSVKKVSPDFERAKSLEEVAFERINLIKEINDKNCNFVFEDYYTSLLEIIQACAFKKGFNILNHVCIGYFLKKVLKKEEMFFIFDDLRQKRNFLTYYGSKMSLKDALRTIKDCQKIIKSLTKISCS